MSVLLSRLRSKPNSYVRMDMSFVVIVITNGTAINLVKVLWVSSSNI